MWPLCIRIRVFWKEKVIYFSSLNSFLLMTIFYFSLILSDAVLLLFSCTHNIFSVTAFLNLLTACLHPCQHKTVGFSSPQYGTFTNNLCMSYQAQPVFRNFLWRVNSDTALLEAKCISSRLHVGRSITAGVHAPRRNNNNNKLPPPTRTLSDMKS